MQYEYDEYQFFENYKPCSRNNEILREADRILREYSSQGYSLTVRACYYRLLSIGMIRSSQAEYKNVQTVIKSGRMSGRIAWNHIADNSRRLEAITTWGNAGELLHAASSQYRRDVWENQQFRPEIWIEKAGLSGVVHKICGELCIPYFATKGYSSITALKDAATRYSHYISLGQTPVCLYFGDSDPSGMQIFETIVKHFATFMKANIRHVEFKRVALMPEQARELNLLPFPVKLSDTRSRRYIEKYGDTCWEVDALTPGQIEQLIRGEVEQLVIPEFRENVLTLEKKDRDLLVQIATRWDEVSKIIAA